MTEIFAHLFGYAAMGIGFYSLTFKEDQKLIIFQIFVNLLLIPHFILLGSYSTALVATFIMLRIMAAYKYKNNYTYSFFMLVGFAQLVYIAYIQMPFAEYLPIIASILVTHTYFKMNGIPMRITFIIGGFLWIATGLLLNSYSVAIINGIGILIHCTTIFRLHKDKKAFA